MAKAVSQGRCRSTRMLVALLVLPRHLRCPQWRPRWPCWSLTAPLLLSHYLVQRAAALAFLLRAPSLAWRCCPPLSLCMAVSLLPLQLLSLPPLLVAAAAVPATEQRLWEWVR